MSMFSANHPLSGNVSAPTQIPTPMVDTAPAIQAADVPVQEQLPTYIDVKISSIHTDGARLATASATLNGCFAIRGIKVMSGSKGPFISMPSYKTSDGYRDVCFPITKDFREQLHATVLEAYQHELAQVQQRGLEPPAAQNMG